MPPQLLVSVRSPQEAIIAARVAVPIIDMKEPNSGSLGMLDSSKINECVNAIHAVNSNLRASAALGEAIDWIEPECSLDFQLPQLDYMKLGLSRLASLQDWRDIWVSIRSRIEACLEDSSQTNWIAVAYADAKIAQAPSIPEIISAAAESNCRGVLFDTFQKGNLRFSDWVSDSQLIKYLESIHNAGMFCSVAGRLNESDVERLAKLPVDVIAVRSAVCAGGKRTAEISEEKIRQLQDSMISSSNYEIENNEEGKFTTGAQRHGGLNSR
ncbi:MAG: hypothetical protein HON04_18800 [Planctomicrobium sp.]|jgi:(5-formylfuran-3-yl)methyl phosphate synthase|nr:hypothetical protein [Planctomicrobium sp.]